MGLSRSRSGAVAADPGQLFGSLRKIRPGDFRNGRGTGAISTGAAGSGYAFTGVKFRIPGQTGLRLGIEGSFDFAGYHTMGTFIGVGF